MDSTVDSTVDNEEIARFAAMADDWWDPSGKFRPLHQLNPARLTFIRDHLAAHFGRDATGPEPLVGLKILDIGCGGGLLTEPLCRLGAAVTGIDAGAEAIAVARAHADQMGLEIEYHHRPPETLSEESGGYDVVLNMEVVEHVAGLPAFLAASAGLVRPGGAMVLSTLNRTLKSLALAKIGAEYILRWVPVGTHDWRKFRRPSELVRHLRPAGVELRALKGIDYIPTDGTWVLSDNLDVNYLMFAEKAETAGS
ncbi:MAG: bifunctional 2-polyprenyl-6-hydroxyphenol methylase/3-demethylubiquinol 3-O-methyltransferase UbiG [Rhodospirillaceae bacterium]|nr:bifunctional 2-polyprenyl-6-hydroxyphenol methylase/3-demethylubiquinol 3-O-methyltransferase UbiG [Rhodospirillaceae bacterium]